MLRAKGIALLVLAGGAAAGWALLTPPARLSPAELAAHYATPLPKPDTPLAVYHLGHSLVGRDMPAMLAQLMGEGHRHASQLGWGASLDQHWRGDVPGFAEENAHPAYRPAHEAIGGGAYDAVVLTEMVELRDAIQHHDSARALADWARLARQARGDVRLYLYETWHRLDDPSGWLARLAQDRAALWEAELLRPAMARQGVGTIHVIPAGQVLAALVTRIEAGEVPGLTRREDLFTRDAQGAPDMIHLNDLGAYVVALTHYAVLSGRPPLGLPHTLQRADGSPATPPTPAAARVMQEVVWQVVSRYAATGIAG
ncbi:hypothetical protein KM031_11075 [Gemmobacter fulvus]|uniref:Uncharacterized protein n=1 Tax=Gemmobacter fulvus TaxID=2840474 RepID=A0A975P3X4_9RHOB|nr:hypothetical protein [Gemmobacter fulvus]QWK89395.1 hypothetical protein KM031_11075 [Gemmobacter fulvus]